MSPTSSSSAAPSAPASTAVPAAAAAPAPAPAAPRTKASKKAVRVVLIVLLVVVVLVVVGYLVYRFAIKKKEKSYREQICTAFKSLQDSTPQIRMPSDPESYSRSLAYNLYLLSLQTATARACDKGHVVPADFDVGEPTVVHPAGKSDEDASKNEPLAFIFDSKSANLSVVVFTSAATLAEIYAEEIVTEQEAPKELIGYATGDLVQSNAYQLYLSGRENLLAEIKKRQDAVASRQFIATGEGLGSSLAQLFMYDQQSRVPGLVVYAFAGPRVGNISFAQRVQAMQASKRLFRVFNTEDVITSLPLPVVDSKTLYQHVSADVPLTLNLKTNLLNHTQAYLDGLR